MERPVLQSTKDALADAETLRNIVFYDFLPYRRPVTLIDIEAVRQLQACETDALAAEIYMGEGETQGRPWLHAKWAARRARDLVPALRDGEGGDR